jgi:hypothetical protein
MDQEFKWLKRADVKPKNRSLRVTKHTLVDSTGQRAFREFVRVEIASYGADQGFYLMHICADGTGTDTWHETLDDAFDQAESEFKISRDEWRDI